MPFEPLRTDEKLEHPSAPVTDMDTQMLGGCAGFVTTSLLAYFLSVWPHLVFSEGYLMRVLFMDLLVGAGPAAILGIFAARKFGLPGATGYLGGTMAFCVFLHLRIQQFLMAIGSRDLPQPEYTGLFVWLVPAAVLAFAALVAAIALPKSERPTAE